MKTYTLILNNVTGYFDIHAQGCLAVNLPAYGFSPFKNEAVDYEFENAKALSTFWKSQGGADDFLETKTHACAREKK